MTFLTEDCLYTSGWAEQDQKLLGPGASPVHQSRNVSMPVQIIFGASIVPAICLMRAATVLIF